MEGNRVPSFSQLSSNQDDLSGLFTSFLSVYNIIYNN